MKVSTPVGEFPYAFDRMRVQGRHLVLEGHMGAWPSRIEIGAADLVALARAACGPLTVLSSAALRDRRVPIDSAARRRRWALTIRRLREASQGRRADGHTHPAVGSARDRARVSAPSSARFRASGLEPRPAGDA